MKMNKKTELQMALFRRVYSFNLMKSLCLLLPVLCLSEIKGQFDTADQEIFGLPSQKSCTMAHSNNSVLDSIYEFKKYGYFTELYRWYYQYNTQQQPDTVWRFLFTGENEKVNIEEIRTYDTAGRLLKLVIKQPDFHALQYMGDSTIIDVYTEEYEYSDGNLSHKTIIDRYFDNETIYEYYYTYDNEHKLIFSIEEENGLVHNYEYSYTGENDLEYVLHSYIDYDGVENVNIVTKYEYEKTDTTVQITRNETYRMEERPLLDTISHWVFMDRFYETYDQQGRRISLKLIQNNVFEGEYIDYLIEYSWTIDNQLLHASYYKWNGTLESGVWEETTRIDNTYDAYGNLLYYEKTYFDDRSHGWEIEESKTYYYTYLPTGISSGHSDKEKLILYPNPAEDEIHLILPSSGSFNFTIYTLYGVPLLNGELENQAIAVSQLQPGIYIIEVSNGHGRYSGKFIKR